MVCVFRLVVRAFQLFRAWGRPVATWDPMTNFILSIRLRNTFVLEVLGWVASNVMWIAATRYMCAGAGC
jgi:hypothetical protein